MACEEIDRRTQTTLATDQEGRADDSLVVGTMTILTPEIIERAQEAANDAGDRYEEFATSAMIRAALEAVIPSLIEARAMPADPTSELLGIICVEQWPADWERGKDAQRRLGLSVVPPNTEMEIAAGQYLRLRDAIRARISSLSQDK